tara:strand:+ start:1257 stop:1772 length:516 start_codon:yes stop_codon:yes gene_type:complete
MIVEVGDILNPDTETIVNPANGLGVMGAGVAGAITSYAGPAVSEEARKLVEERGKPFEAGEAYATKSGRLYRRRSVKRIYHAVTMKYPGSFTSIDIVGKAMLAVLKLAIADKIDSIAFPGLGTGIGRLDLSNVANVMVDMAQQHDHEIVIKIIDLDSRFIAEIQKMLGIRT